jgi:hypothetical protein
MLEPSHSNPGGQSLQAVRSSLEPPDVNEPAKHTEQFDALFSLKK